MIALVLGRDLGVMLNKIELVLGGDLDGCFYIRKMKLKPI